MKKLKRVLASMLALSCINLVACGEEESFTVTLQDGSNVLDTIDVNKDAELKMPQAIAKEGYDFVGWYVDAELTTEYTPDVVSGNLTLYAKYVARNLRISLDLDGGELEEGVAKYVTVKHNETYALPVPTKTNYDFVGWEIENDDGTKADFPASGTYNRTSGCFVTAKWQKVNEDAEEEGAELFINKGTYFKERASVEDDFTFVFVTGKTYNFNTLTNLEIEGAGSSVEQDGLSFKTLKADEEFTLHITKEVGGTEVQYERTAKIVDQVETFDNGNDYLTAWGASVDRSVNFQDASKTVAATTMSVGKSNYIPDLAMYNESDEALTLESAYVGITVKDDGVATEDYTIVDGAVSFGDSVEVGSVVEVTYKPKYTLNNQTITVKMKVNNGVNVYNNEQLRAAYGDDAVSELNILRNVKAEVAPEDMVPGYNVPINEYEKAIYARNVFSQDDEITVNGNFFKIDGSGLPYMNNTIGGQDWQDSNPAYRVANMQVGIFQYKNEVETESGNQYIHNGKVTFNDLYITANFIKDADDMALDGEYEDESGNTKDRNLLTQSGAYHGIVLRGGRATLNNVTVMNSNIALFTGSKYSYTDATQAASQWTVNNSKMKHAWSNLMYMYGATTATFSGSYLGDSTGAAIHLDDVPYNKADTQVISAVTLSQDTVVENFIAGTEAYFTSRGMADVATGMQTQLEQVISQATGGLSTVVKKESIDGTDVTKFNLVLLVRGQGDTSDWKSSGNENVDAQGQPAIMFTSPYMFNPQTQEIEIEGEKQVVPQFDENGRPIGFDGYFAFSDGTTDPATLMFGYVEVMLASK